MQKQIRWKITRTACYPNEWKIEAIGYRDDNSTANFFPTYEAAKTEIKRRKGEVSNDR